MVMTMLMLMMLMMLMLMLMMMMMMLMSFFLEADSASGQRGTEKSGLSALHEMQTSQPWQKRG